VKGDEVRDTRFLGPAGKFSRGYDAAEVDELLGRIAAELDAERQVGFLIKDAVFGARTGAAGYDVEAVDWFLEQLRCREDHPELARMSDPWRDLAVANYFTRSGPGDLAERPATPSRRAHRKDRAQDRKCLVRECADAWRDFGQQPGAQLRWGLTSARHLWSAVRAELQTAEQQAVASVRSWSADMDRPATVSAGGRTFTWKRVTGSAWPGIAEIVRRSDPEYGAGRSLDADTPDSRKPRATASSLNLAVRALREPIRELRDEMGAPIFYATGKNYDGSAGSCITFPDQRWLKFPVRGTERANAVMTAVDQAGNKVARYRDQDIADGLGNEITVHPGQQLTDELVLALVISAPWFHSFFTTSGGGG
jgi:DivIVA domain-containing protein